MGKQTTPRVPIQTPMFDERGNLTRTWIIFFERLGKVEQKDIEPPIEPGGAAGPWQRTLLIKDATVGVDIADHVTVYQPGVATKVTTVLRKVITTNLQVRINKNAIALITITIPSSTSVDVPIDFTAFATTPAGIKSLAENDVLSWDIITSDGQRDRNGVASVTLEWAPPPSSL